MNAYLFSFTMGLGDEFPICYQLVHAETANHASWILSEHFNNNIYNIENCTISW